MKWNAAVNVSILVHWLLLFTLSDSSRSRCDGDDCLSCTHVESNEMTRCLWDVPLSKCRNVVGEHRMSESSDIVYYADRCITSPPTPPSDFLSNWMEQMLPALGELSLLDLSLPGTHDSLTYDLSLRTSDGGIDDSDRLAEILHNYTKLVPDGIEDFIRQQAQTHTLSITDQLNNGIRFIDFRMMYEYTDEDPNWYSLHFVQSNQPSSAYFKQIRQWLDDHPKEIVVLWLSKHGSECSIGDSQYPNTSIEVKQAYWSEILTIFDGLLPDYTNDVKINETSVTDMIKMNARVVLYVSDYVEFTNSSDYALDGCFIDNNLGPSVDDEINALQWEYEQFANAKSKKMEDKKQQKFYLMSMATGVPSEQVVFSALLKWAPSTNNTDKEIANCASAFNIPDMNWCPETLLDVANLENYYKQISLEGVIGNASLDFPNAIYINGVDYEGTIRTGTTNLWGAQRGNSEYATTAYAYVDTILLYNLAIVCNGDYTHNAHGIKTRDKWTSQLVQMREDYCSELNDTLVTRRAAHPYFRWNDPVYGRSVDWPVP